MSFIPRRILIACGGTGGHLFPGIALAQELRKRGHEPLLLISQKKVDAEAAQPYADFNFLTIPAIAKPATFSLKMIPFLFALLKSKSQCKQIIKEHKIDAVLGMGGFTSLPPILAARALGKEIYVHDSNALPGKATRFAARYCKKVLIGLQEAASYFKKGLSVQTGTPIRDEFLQLPSKQQAREQLGVPQEVPLILCMGGSQGARQLNTLITEAATQQAEVHYLIIAGAADEARLRELAGSASNITLMGFCSQMAAAYAAADGIIARSGASSLTEISRLGKASLLIPYPYAADDHQSHNARAYSQHGAARMCPQQELNSAVIHQFVQEVILDEQARIKMQQAMLALSIANPSQRIADELDCPAN